jgi:type IX secretion system PorP/SprF family membrane protein
MRNEKYTLKKIRTAGLTVLAAVSACLVQAQDIHFSQFFEAPLLRNPSLAGLFTGDYRIQGIYRDQWNSVANAYKTGSVNGEYKMPVGNGHDYMTVGLQMLYDRAGTVGWVSVHALPALNYHKSISDVKNMYLSLGFMGGVVHRRFDRSKMTTNSQYDGMGDGENFGNPQYTYADGSVGMSINGSLTDNPNDNFFAGLAYHHFNRPKGSFYRNANIEMHPKWVASAGLRFDVSDNSFATLQADYSKQGGHTEMVGGATYGIRLNQEKESPSTTIHGGAFLRWNDALIPVVKLEYAPFAVSVSYDVNISKLKTASMGRGGFEISVSYVGFSSRLDKSSINSILCPRF